MDFALNRLPFQADHPLEHAAHVADAGAVDGACAVDLGGQPQDEQGEPGHQAHLGEHFPERRIMRHAQDQQEGREERNP